MVGRLVERESSGFSNSMVRKLKEPNSTHNREMRNLE